MLPEDQVREEVGWIGLLITLISGHELLAGAAAGLREGLGPDRGAPQRRGAAA